MHVFLAVNIVINYLNKYRYMYLMCAVCFGHIIIRLIPPSRFNERTCTHFTNKLLSLHYTHLWLRKDNSIVEPLVLDQRLEGGGGGPDLAFPLLFHENPASRTFFIAIPNFVFSFPKMHEKRLISAKAGPFD